MTGPFCEQIGDDFDKLTGILSAARAALNDSPGTVSAQTLHEVAEAHRLLARVINLLVTHAEAGSESILDPKVLSRLNNMKRPVTDLQLKGRGKTVFDEFRYAILQDGRPVEVRKGIQVLGELVQVKEVDLLVQKNCSTKTLSSIITGLEAFDLRIEASLSDLELAYVGVPRITREEDIGYRGAVSMYEDGRMAAQLGAKETLKRPLALDWSSAFGIPSYESWLVEDSEGRVRPIRTLGDLVQLPIHYFGYGLERDLPIGCLDAILNRLLPVGLCFGMKLSQFNLAALDIERVEYHSFNDSNTTP